MVARQSIPVAAAKSTHFSCSGLWGWYSQSVLNKWSGVQLGQGLSQAPRRGKSHIVSKKPRHSVSFGVLTACVNCWKTLAELAGRLLGVFLQHRKLLKMHHNNPLNDCCFLSQWSAVVGWCQQVRRKKCLECVARCESRTCIPTFTPPHPLGKIPQGTFGFDNHPKSEGTRESVTERLR